MSALTGVWQWDGRPVSRSALGTLAAASFANGLRRPAIATPAPGLALQVQVLPFDSLSAKERQPYRFGDSVLTWDGRLDNRDELLLALNRDLGSDESDAALVAGAFARWGTGCLPRLLGDWCLALWDASSQKVILARDYAGTRPLHYRTAPDGLAWASRLDALAACFGQFDDLDDAYIASRLMYTEPPDELTPFRLVRVLPPGYFLSASRGQDVEIKRFWAFEAARIQYQRASEYTDQLRNLLTEAVRVRLRANRTVWAHLSGGWDSSSVVCLADALIRRGNVEAPALQPLSAVSSGSPESDERTFIEVVEQWCDLKTICHEYPGAELFTDWLGVHHPSGVPARFNVHAPVARARDSIVLTGRLGDFVMIRGNIARRAAMMEALHQGPPWRFVSLLFHYARENRRPLPVAFARMLWYSYVPSGLQQQLRRRRTLSQRTKDASVSKGSLAKAFGVTPRIVAATPPPHVLDPSFAVGFPRAKQPLIDVLAHLAGRQGAHNDHTPDVWLTDPFSHRPLVAFMLAAPHLAFWHPAFPRFGMQRALADILPPKILTRRSKGNTEAVLARAEREWDELWPQMRTSFGAAKDWQLVRRDYLDPTALADALDGQSRGPIHDWVRLEGWLRTLSILKREIPTLDTAASGIADGSRTEELTTS